MQKRKYEENQTTAAGGECCWLDLRLRQIPLTVRTCRALIFKRYRLLAQSGQTKQTKLCQTRFFWGREFVLAFGALYWIHAILQLVFLLPFSNIRWCQ